MATLYVVATPIGNLEDVTLRALRILREVSLIAAEDTRTTRKLLQRYDIHTSMVSFYEQNRAMRIPYILSRLKEADVAVVSDAGTPTIHDPGRELVEAAKDLGIAVMPIPGPSAVTAALAVSGLPSEQFLFLGFLPRRRKERRELLQSIASEPRTLVLFETPHRLHAALLDLAEILGGCRLIAVCRELTKLFEEVYKGTIVEAAAHFSTPRGEFTLVIGGALTPLTGQDIPLGPEVIEELRLLKAQGLSAKEAVTTVTHEHGLSRRRVYAIWLKL